MLGLRPWPRWRVGRRLCSAPRTRASYTPTPRRGSLPSQRVHGRRQSHPLALPHPLDAAVALGAPTRKEGTGCSGQKGTAATRSPAPQGHPSPASVRQRCQAERLHAQATEVPTTRPASICVVRGCAPPPPRPAHRSPPPDGAVVDFHRRGRGASQQRAVGRVAPKALFHPLRPVVGPISTDPSV